MFWRTKGTWCTSDETGVIVHLAQTYELSFDVAHLLRAIHYLVHEYE